MTVHVTGDWELSVHEYCRPFRKPLTSARGAWTERRGLVIRLRCRESGRTGYGEVAPLPAFGSEDLDTARRFFRQLEENKAGLDLDLLLREAPPSSAFGLWSALEDNAHGEDGLVSAETAALLSLGEETPSRLSELRARGYQTFKLKLGTRQPSLEWATLQRLVTVLHQGEQLRLDPNRSWGNHEWAFWKPRLEEIAHWIEFLEDPFRPQENHLSLLRDFNHQPLPLALDESLHGEGMLGWWLERKWDGFWIIKPSLSGAVENWLPPLKEAKASVILSSAFETGIGLSAIIQLCQHFREIRHGLGTQSYFSEDFGLPQEGSRLNSLTHKQTTDLWNLLSES